ncbi:T9SS type A sorting domain-containing protein [Tenacibaculum soleae]|uniref:T9SS type A sorting domain-containing protein n=1 Tax=Tenacibaculum soleae TaxID=447689 RepID=UPI0026E480D2|nr:T9SS type A sorting domain-containing protein [Tenacibaculum soleae]MDO6744886.1 T9SS type A sorting domain-containing protein [Tenacibaculum soleae]
MEKKITLNTKIFSFLFIFLGILNTISQNDNGQIDAPGDIAFVAYHDNDDGFSFILLDDCPNNTSIRFTDDEWNGTTFVTPTGEGEVLWTNNTGNTITKGNIINITDADDNSGGITASSGTASESDPGFSTAVIDELFAFTGSRAAPGTFLAFIGDINGNSLANTGLTDGVTANIITEEGYYNGSPICNGSLTDCAALINTSSSNWSFGGYSFPTTVPSSFSGSTFNGGTPTISSVSSSNGNGTYKVGDVIAIIVNFSENVTVTGTPQITLETGVTDRTINYTSGSGTDVLTFNYTVQVGDISADLDYISTGAILFNGGTIQNGSGTNADITLATPGAANSLGANKAIVVDGVVPTVTSTSSSTANGTYKTGDVIAITTTFSEAVTVTGTPQITIETGATDRTVNYISGSGSTVLTFAYAVQAGDISADLDYVATNSLILNSGTIKDAAGNNATLTLATPGAANSLGANKAIIIDGIIPTVMSTSSSNSNGTYKTGDVIAVTTTFSETVAVTGTPQITIETGTTDRTINYTAGSGTSTLTFNYTIQAGDESTDLDYVATNSLILNSGTIKDAAGNDATLILATPGAANSLGANKAIVVDGVVPIIMSVNVPASATYTAGQNLDFTVNFNENIVVNTTNGTPQIAITIGSTLRQAAYISGSGTSSLLFRHTVIVGDLDIDGIAIGSLANNMGTLKDTSGNDANLTLNSVSNTTGVLVGNPTITWTGTINNNWTTAGNWNTNTIPTNSANVIIPSGVTNYPTISSAVTVNSINIASGASLIANATVTAPVTYNRNLPTTNWYLVAPPVNNETTQDIIANHTFATGSGANIGIGAYNNDHATNTWNYLNISSTGSVISGTGASMKLDAPGDVSITGNINVTNVAIPVSMGGRDNFNLIGNPFTSYINSAVLAGDNSVIENGTFWLWDGSQYQTYNNASPINIAPAQGFFVEANTNTNIVFSTANQSHQSSDTFLRQAPNPSFELFLENDGNKKSTKVFYVANKTAGFDKGYDSKMFNGVTHDFAVFTELLENNEGKKLAIQTLPNSNYQKMIIPVGIIGKAGEQVTFSINSKNIPSGIQLYLEDRENNLFTNLSNKNYTVSLKSNTNNSGQFYIHTSAKKPNNTDIKEDIQNVNIYKSINNNITISGLQTDKYSVNIYSILGKKIMTSEFKATGTHVVELPKIASGIYVVELSSSLGKVNKKIILE